MLFILLAVLPLCADQKFLDYPSFRFGSGLPGGGWGVLSDSTVGFEGALLLNVPVAYTPSRYSGVMGLHVGQLTDDFAFEIQGPEVNSTGVIGLGLGTPGRGLFTAAEATSVNGEWIFNFQHELMCETRRRPSLAIGVQDWDNLRPASALAIKRNAGRSFYVTSTKQFGSARHPLYLTAGLGNRRFKGAFGGLTYRAADRVSAFGEYDGIGFNAGLGLSVLGDPGERKHNLTFLASVVDIGGDSGPALGMAYTVDDQTRPKLMVPPGHRPWQPPRAPGPTTMLLPRTRPGEVPPPPRPLPGEPFRDEALERTGMTVDLARQSDAAMMVRIEPGELEDALVAMAVALAALWQQAPEAPRITVGVFRGSVPSIQIGINREAYPRVLHTRLTADQRQLADGLLTAAGFQPIPPEAAQ
ncbi:MAG: hypothetical protein ACE5R4_04080 [Armatimonadota bacterium]